MRKYTRSLLLFCPRIGLSSWGYPSLSLCLCLLKSFFVFSHVSIFLSLHDCLTLYLSFSQIKIWVKLQHIYDDKIIGWPSALSTEMHMDDWTHIRTKRTSCSLVLAKNIKSRHTLRICLSFVLVLRRRRFYPYSIIKVTTMYLNTFQLSLQKLHLAFLHKLFGNGWRPEAKLIASSIHWRQFWEKTITKMWRSGTQFLSSNLIEHQSGLQIFA